MKGIDDNAVAAADAVVVAATPPSASVSSSWIKLNVGGKVSAANVRNGLDLLLARELVTQMRRRRLTVICYSLAPTVLRYSRRE